ncbi:MAG TPA: biopolymer transporter ExbD [Pyrinomonadaceae bacterium]|nr:biopolymer transporter ExbD [Pyrinomonadaceae bacterium]
MKKINLIIIISALLLNISCDSIKNAVNTVTNKNPIKLNFKLTDNPRNVKNAKPDAHVEEDTAIIVTLSNPETCFIGLEEFPLETVGAKISLLLEKSPAERENIYLNVSASTQYLPFVKMVDKLRLNDIKQINLIVLPEVKTDVQFHVLKVKVMPEPKADETDDEEYYKMTMINLSKDGKINFARNDKKTYFTLDKEEIKPEDAEAKIKQFLKEREEKKVLRTGTNEIDKRIYIKATKSSNYAQVVKLLDAATGAGADVYLQIDDLSE